MTYEITPTRWPVFAWPRIQQLIGPVDANVAGGYAAWHMSDRFNWRYAGQPHEPFTADFHLALRTMVPSDYPSDLDIFTYSDSGYYTMVKRLDDAGFEMLKESKFCSTWEDIGGFFNEDNWSHLRYSLDDSSVASNLKSNVVIRPKECRLPIQLIKPIFGKNLYEVLEHFDFYAVKFALLDGQTMLAHKDAVKCLDERTLKHAHPDASLGHPFYVLGRAMKYAKKGYKVNYMELYKLVVNAQAVDIANQDITLVHKMLVHFGQYLNSGESLGRGEDFRDVFQDAYGEWLRYILKKNAKIQ